MTSEWAWIGVDDFYFWDGKTANFAFANADLEQGDLTNWNEEINAETWLSGTVEMVNEGLAPHNSLNDHVSYIDGNFSADSAIASDGDGATGVLYSNPFVIPITSSNISEWSLF